MKSKWTILLFSILFMSTLWGCTQEDDLDDYPTIGEENNGIYFGSLKYEIAGTDVVVPQKVSVRKSKDEHVDLTMSNIAFAPNEFITVVAKDIKASIEEVGGVVTLSTLQPYTRVEAEVDYSKYTIRLKGTIEEGKLTLDGEIRFGRSEENEQESVEKEDVVPTQKYSFEFNGMYTEVAQSSEAEIKSLGFDSAAILGEGIRFNKQTNEIKLPIVKGTTEEELKQIKIVLELSEGATCSPESGSIQDLSHPVTYTITSEDGIVQKKYTISIFEYPPVFTFDEWFIANPEASKESQYVLPESLKGFEWASTDASFAPLMDKPESSDDPTVPLKPANDFGIKATDDAVSVKAAKVQTLKMQASKLYKVPAIGGGMLYTGKYKLSLNDKREYMRLGFPINYKPTALKLSYKYKRGDVFYKCLNPVADPTQIIALANHKDECLIRVVLFEVNDLYNQDEMIDLDTFMGNDEVVAVGQFTSADNQEVYQSLEIPLNYLGDGDFNYRKNYRIAIGLFSSAEFLVYSGAPGSTLWVDNLEIITE